MSVDRLVEVFIDKRLERERKAAEQKKSEGGQVYLPKEEYRGGDAVVFPNQEWQTGTVTNIRDARTYDASKFKVVEVEFEDGAKREYASGLEDHQLNVPPTIDEDDPLLSPSAVLTHTGDELAEKLKEGLEDHSDFVYIAGKWFPRALLIDVNAIILLIEPAFTEDTMGK